MKECLGEDHPLHHSAGKGVAVDGALGSHTHMIKALLHAILAFGPIEPVGCGEVLEKLKHFQVSDHRSEVRHVTEDRMDAPWIVEDIHTKGFDLAVGRLEQGGQYPDDAGFSRTVWTHKSKQASGWHMKAHPVNGGEVVVVHTQVFYHQSVFGRGNLGRNWR